MKRKISQISLLLALCLTFYQPVLLQTGGPQEEDDQRDIRAKEVLKGRRPGKNPQSGRREPYSALKEFPDGPPPNRRTHITVGMTLWRVRLATEAENKDPKVSKEWMTWDKKDHEVVVTRISDLNPIPNQDLIQMTIEYLPNRDGVGANRAGYLYVINRELFPDGSLRNARLIFPTLLTYGGDNRVLPGKTVTLPDPKRPFVISRAVSGDVQASETYTIILSRVSLHSDLPQPLGETAMKLSPKLVDRWEQRWAVREFRADLKGGVGQSRTQRELNSSGDLDETRGTKDSEEDLTQDDLPPQTVFRSVVKPGAGMLFTVRVPFKETSTKP